MKQTQDVVACVCDFGIFIHFARRLAQEFGKVYYTTPWESAFPRVKDAVIGDGYPEIEWVESLWEVKDKCDLFVFPDIGLSDTQDELVKQGKAVWGARGADELEAMRGKFLKSLAAADLEVPPHTIIKGLTNLRMFLADNPDKFIKVSSYRGDFETFHFRSMSEDGGVLDNWAVTLGPLSETVTFYVFDKIDTDIEDGCDAWCIDGQWPQTVIHGFENKDRAYLGTFQRMDRMPEQVRIVNERYGPILAGYGYRGSFSSEVRITGDKSYFIDATCRCASPCSQVECEMIGNLGEIVWRGANGEMVEAEQKAKFGAQAIFKVDRDDWAVFKLPDEIKDHVFISFSCMVDGMICVPPDSRGVCEIGWVRGTGDTIAQAVNNVIEYAGKMPDGVHVETTSLADVLREVMSAEEHDMPFTEQEIPDPEIVLQD